MVKHGRNKKARSSSRRAPKLKSSYVNGKQKFIAPKFTDDSVRGSWDPARPPRENLRAMGLKSAVNDGVRKPSGRSEITMGSVDAGKAIELFDIPVSGKFEKGRTKADVMLGVSVERQRYIVDLLKKHGTDYVKMSRDIKVNTEQETARQLEKLANKYFKLGDKERVVECPDNVKDMIEDATE